MKIPELLAPAGSYETLIAVANAGADAIYIGGNKFGARAYAQNLSEEEIINGMNYLHIHDKKMYLTLNTLIKNTEMKELFDFIHPLYINGLDGIIVQDLGIIAYLQEVFPKLPIHISTQAASCSIDSLNHYSTQGIKRAVMARELSLEELKYIKTNTNIEIEVFVHGAMCYSYSGMCLYSSLIGGRSGNRGRCAQPCRLKYKIDSNINEWMSLKDLESLRFLDKLCNIGIDSFKIEGRMKSTQYASGVTAIYRKYLNILKNDENYCIDNNDIKKLEALFHRRGYSDGYFFNHNERNMLSTGNTKKYNEIDNDDDIYFGIDKIDINLSAVFHVGHPVVISLYDQTDCVSISGSICLVAQNAPLTIQSIREKLNRFNDTFYNISIINIDLDDNCFIPVSELNSLRRQIIIDFTDEKIKKYKRSEITKHKFKNNKNLFCNSPIITASFLDFDQAECLYDSKLVKRIYFPDELFFNNKIRSIDTIKIFQANNIQCYLSMPPVFRKETRDKYIKNLNYIDEVFDGLLVKNLDEAFFINGHIKNKKTISDYTLYAFNNYSVKQIESLCNYYTASVELSKNELNTFDLSKAEIIVYGRYPMMYSANCLIKNSSTCNHSNSVLRYYDKLNYEFYVKASCGECYNTIYNTNITSLLGVFKQVIELNPFSMRLAFTFENKKEIKKIIDDLNRPGLNHNDPDNYTRGHFLRGVE